jgi:hypothetical protein
VLPKSNLLKARVRSHENLPIYDDEAGATTDSAQLRGNPAHSSITGVAAGSVDSGHSRGPVRVRNRLRAGGRWIRTIGSAPNRQRLYRRCAEQRCEQSDAGSRTASRCGVSANWHKAPTVPCSSRRHPAPVQPGPTPAIGPARLRIAPLRARIRKRVSRLCVRRAEGYHWLCHRARAPGRCSARAAGDAKIRPDGKFLDSSFFW